jgi:hypothetical protein
MKKLVLILSVVAVSFALQAGDGTCSKSKAACCDKSKVATCDKSKVAAGDKVKTGTCDKAKKAEEAAQKPAPSPETPS